MKDTNENDAKKLEDIPKGTPLRVMDTFTMPDGTEKAYVAREGPTAEGFGWVMVQKEGSGHRGLEPMPTLALTFDLKVHTANALSRALARKAAPVEIKKKKATGLPSMIAGRRPTTKAEDGPDASRHKHVDKPASVVALFNCMNAAFEVTNWTGESAFDKISGEQSFDLVAPKSKKRLGRVKLANELGMPFLDRVEFPDVWLLAEDHGVMHDGWQGEGTIEVELTWGKEVATILVHPWLAYGCSVGARFLIRKLGMPYGQCGTVQRILGDDRVVARVDSFSKAEGVKGETIIDLSPSTVVRTTSVGYARDTRLLLLHNGKLQDVQVLTWLGGTDHQEGSRHHVNVKPIGAPVGMHAWHDLNNFNHVVALPDFNADKFEEARVAYCNFVKTHEDRVEDAITGNSLQIKDQLIFMKMLNVPDGCNPPNFAVINDVPKLVNESIIDSPKRTQGTHLAQPVLCRAGPGTGKTWMIKQALYLLAEHLEEAGRPGIRLVPIIVFVQRIVRLLRELGDDPSALLQDPNGMMRWYINSEFSDRKTEATLLLQAYEMSALAILVDGVDEAAGMRDIVESFVHYELVPSGNRLVVTSRPEGVDLEDYKTRFVVMNLLELSQEQQRNVIQMQLQGNAFFEHLVNIAECRKDLDGRYREAFRSEALRNEIESLLEFTTAETIVEQQIREEEEKRKLLENEDDAEPITVGSKGGVKGPTDGAQRVYDSSAKSKLPVTPPAVRRRLALDNHADLQGWMAKIDLQERSFKSKLIDGLNKKILKPTRAYQSLLDQLDVEIRLLPSPSARAQVEKAVETLEEVQPGKRFDPLLRDVVAQLALQRRMPLAGGRRGAKAAPIPAIGLWFQAALHTDEKYVIMERSLPAVYYVLGVAAANAGVRQHALQADEKTGEHIQGTAPTKPELTWRNPIDLWAESTYATAAEPTELPPESWVISLLIKCEQADQCLFLLRRLTQGIEVALDGDDLLCTIVNMRNGFESLHPTHLRSASCHMLLTYRGYTLAFMLNVEHKDLLDYYDTASYHLHYDFFHHRVINLTQSAFDAKFEMLLLFLVEAIGVPVLLSLLLLTYSNQTGGDIIDLDDLPEQRLQLYKLGIMAGIRKRMMLDKKEKESEGAAESGAKDGKEEGEQKDAEGAAVKKREKRKVALEQNIGGVATAGATMDTSKVMTKHATNEPVLDLNSILRGKKVRVVTGEDEVAEAYSLVVRVLDKSKQAGFDMRTGITAVVPKSHTMHAPVSALVEYVLAPNAMTDAQLQETGKTMLRRVAVSNQENGRREFTSKNVACALGAYPEELGMWSRLDLDHDNGVALCATLAKQSDKAPAQYQFKHLSFQEGLYAEHLLLLVTSLAPPNGPGWPGWATNEASATFLNNRYMNNTCRIAAGDLGGLLAGQRAHWDFREATLTPNGRSALWYITDDNPKVESVNVAQNEVGSDDVGGLAKMVQTCTALQLLDLSENDLVKLTVDQSEWQHVCDALGTNSTLTNLNLNSNHLGALGVRIASRALIGATALKRLGFSYNEPGVEPALSDLLRAHPSLTSIELVEAIDRHFPSRSKDDVGRALLENKAKKLGFLHCDMFVLSEETKSLVWPKEALTSDAVLLAGVLTTNTILTTFNIATGANLDNKARSALGEALLNNPGSRVAFCNDFGLTPGVDNCEFDLSRSELKDVEPFRLLAGCLRGNRTLTHVTLMQLRMEQIATLALALRGNSTLAQLDIIHTTRTGGQSVVRLPVPKLNGSTGEQQPPKSPVKQASKADKDAKSRASRSSVEEVEVEKDDPRNVDLSKTCLEGHIGRVACAMIGTLIAPNTSLTYLDLSDTGIGQAIGSEGEGGHILLRPLCESNTCPLTEVNLSNIQLNDKAGTKLMSALATGLGKGDCGYEKITRLNLSNNELGKGFTTALKQLLWGERAPCMLQSLNLSGNSTLDGYDCAIAIKRNESLTSLDLRDIPSANSDDVYSFLGSFLLQDECSCRLGFLSCDMFQVVAGQTELVLQTTPPKTEEEAPPPAATDVVAGQVAKTEAVIVPPKANSVIMLLAGVVKFNTSLSVLCLAATGLDSTAASYFATALRENTVLQSLDLSNNPLLSAEGITSIAEACRTHPSLVSIKVDGAALPLAQLRGAKGTEPTLDVTDWGLGHLSGCMIGIVARSNRMLVSLNLKSNLIGADGLKNVVSGLGEAPLKVLDLTRNGLGGEEPSVIDALSVTICRHLGSLVDLRMDENDLDCPADALAPLCKLRNLRTLSLERNRLTEVPSLIGTMLSLRKVSLHSNQLVQLPGSICLLTSLESFDVHKNALVSLPAAIGNLKQLQKLDLSENRISELPISICELTESLQFSVGRNPLEKPSVEQARQGIGAIRRFFGFSRARDADKAGGDEEDAVGKAVEELNKPDATRPVRDDEQPSRHDWAGPASVILLFNLHGCGFRVVDGAADFNSVAGDETYDLHAGFNMQQVGRIREARGMGESVEDRVEFTNGWLPWRTQDVSAEERPTMTVQLRKGKSVSTLLVMPWLAYGCSVGARLHLASGSYATVVSIQSNDTCEIVRDNATVAPEKEELIDPRPDTVARTSSPSYKSGQKLLLLYQGRPVDAIVDEWLGVRKGSRHRVRIGTGAAKGGNPNATRSKKGEKMITVEVDLNEVNHSRLLFTTVTKYEDARQQLLERVLQSRLGVVRDEISQKDLQIGDQRVYLTPKTDEVVSDADGPAAAPEAAPDPPSPEDEGRRRRPSMTQDVSPSGSPTMMRSESPPGVHKVYKAAANLTNALDLFSQLIAPLPADAPLPPPVVVRAQGKTEHEMTHSQAMYSLATALNVNVLDGDDAVRLVPLSLNMARVVEHLADERERSAGPREIIVKIAENDNPGTADVVRQAIELHALVFVCEVASEAELATFKEAVGEEVLLNRTIVTMYDVADKLPLPAPLAERASEWLIDSIGLCMSESKLTNRMCKELFKRMAQPNAAHYSIVTSLHLPASELGRESSAELTELLVSPQCNLLTLDLSYTAVDGFTLAQALNTNSTLTSLDVRMISEMRKMYKTIGDVLLAPSCTCKLSFLRCDDFEVLENEKGLSLREKPLAADTIHLLTGVLRHNRSLHELDLSATDIEQDAVIALAAVLESNPSLTSLRLAYLPALDEAARVDMSARMERSNPNLRLEL